MKNEKILKIFFIFIWLYAFTSSFSISLQQLFFVLAILLFLLGYSKLFRFRWYNYYIVFFLWALWRLFHVFISPEPTAELIEYREVWLFFMFPLIADGVIAYSFSSEKKPVYFFSKTPFEVLLIALLLGGAFTGYYNSILILFQKGGFFETNIRAEGFGGQNALTFSGAISFALSLGTAIFWIYYREYLKNPNPKNRNYLIFLGFLLTGTLLAFFLAKSRGGYIALFLTFSFMLFFYRPKKVLLFFLVVVLIASLSFIFSKSFREYFVKAIPKADHHENTLEQRRDLWVAGWAMFKEKPLLGWGDVGYYQNYPHYKVEGARGVALKGSHMHNDMLQAAVSYGLPGFLLYCTFFLVPVMVFLKMQKQQKELFRHPYMVMSIFATVFLFFQGLTQCHFTDDEVVTLFWLNQGIFFGLLNYSIKSPS